VPYTILVLHYYKKDLVFAALNLSYYTVGNEVYLVVWVMSTVDTTNTPKGLNLSGNSRIPW